MGVERIGGVMDAVKIERDPLALSGLGNRILEFCGALDTAELRMQVAVLILARRRHIRVELERPPVDGGTHIVARRQGALEPAFADETPGANRIGIDIDLNHGRTVRLRPH